MMDICFTIPGQPMGKQRPRFGRGRTYTPEKTVQYQQQVQNEAINHFKKPSDRPIELIVLATFEPPKSWSKKKRQDALNTYHIQKPDFDNVEKIIADALNGLAYKDDSQIASSKCRKVWGESPKVVVVVRELT